jgi:hypothetical protein
MVIIGVSIIGQEKPKKYIGRNEHSIERNEHNSALD